MQGEVKFRDAMPSDIKSLNALIRASKGFWNYSNEFMDKFMDMFQLTDTYLSKNTVKVMLMNGQIVGLTGFKQHPDKTLELDYFFIDPNFIGQGLGKQLWNYSCNVARQLTDNSFIVWSDPSAEAFYKKMGCKKIGMKKSPLMSNRQCPIMRYDF